ncbi:hypothetical protein ACEE23_07645 [Corynebacterium sp. 32222D000AT]|uniref:hypothetical protein n=1 Tax=unclassified Corynebacterium TaxID=2624378 RepID=UPI002A9EFB4A|nr:hypothetical protein [Mycobacteriaceae bacterium]MDY5829221.1 hypothetical protein [Corynebacterium sp.]
MTSAENSESDKALLYVKTTLHIPGAGAAIHVAEMQQLDARSCRIHRLIAQTPDGQIAGAVSGSQRVGSIDKPNSTVPHPDTYASYPDIDAEYLAAADFESLWVEAQLRFPGL